MANRGLNFGFVFSVTSLALVLSFNSPALADSINNLTATDSTFTLFGINGIGGDVFVLTPDSTVYTGSGFLPGFGSGLPLGWRSGSVTLTVSFDNQQFVKFFPSFQFFGAACAPTALCVEYFLDNLPPITHAFPATLTISYGGTNGGTASADFIISPVPEPGTILSFCTGAALLTTKCRSRKPRRCTRL